MREGRWLAAISSLILVAVGCEPQRAEAVGHAATPVHSGAKVGADRSALFAAQDRRDSAAIDREALSSRDVTVRRLAARALSRIADAPAVELLILALDDEDAEVETWAAYGLGYACHGREAKTVRALVARAASLQGEPEPATSNAPALASPSEAISDALGRCAGTEAESTLRAWLQGPRPRAEAASLGLGRIASQLGKLDDSTLVALLDAANRAQGGLQNALFPLTRMATLNASTAERARDIAQRLAMTPSVSAQFAVRVLSRTGDAGNMALATLLTNPALAPGLRAQAVRELSALGSAGQHALWSAFNDAAFSVPSDPELSGEAYGPFSALLDALQPPILGSAAKLQSVADSTLRVPGTDALTRRKVHVRCAAAALLAGTHFQSARLLACDPAADSRERELAILRVIGREKLRGARKQAFLARASSSDDIVREAALDQLTEHSEISESYQLLTEALTAKSLGVVASAAHVLATHPERAARRAAASGDAPNPDPAVSRALTQAYAQAGARNSVEVQSLLLDAMGALQILTLKDAANGACRSDNPTLREHAQKTLHLLGEQARLCDAPKPQSAASLTAPTQGNALLTLETDAGTLTLALDATYAPSAVARIVGLAQAGFYDGTVVHRVVPGFVAQFGDPEGDGYGGDDKPPLRCETSPLPFLSGSIGVALSGRDTGSSQLFVTLGRYPHLDGQYAWLGAAGAGWERLAAGDRILRVHVTQAH